MYNSWNGFKGEQWKNEIDVSDFIKENYTEYSGNAEFLSGATSRTNELLK